MTRRDERARRSTPEEILRVGDPRTWSSDPGAAPPVWGERPGPSPLVPVRDAPAPPFTPFHPHAPRPEVPPRRSRALVVAAVLVVVSVLAGVTFSIVQRVPDADLAASDPPPMGAVPPGTSTSTIRRPTTTRTAPPTTTPAPPTTRPEAGALRGRPAASPVVMDDTTCRSALRPGAFSPLDWTAWDTGELVVPASAVTDEQARAEITTIMRRRFRNQDPEQAVQDALALYDAAVITKATDDDPALRAGLAELKGTIGEPVLRYLETSKRPVIFRYGATKEARADAEAHPAPRLLTITVGASLRTERPAALAPVLFHELLHQGTDAPAFDEELIANGLDSRVAIEMFRDYPEALTVGTARNRANRWAALGALNTRVGTDMTFTRSEGSMYPKTQKASVRTLAEELRNPQDYPSYAALPDVPALGHETLTAVLWTMAGGDPSPSPASFDDESLAFIDTHAGLTSCDQLITAGVLGLLPPGGAHDRLVKAYIANLPS